MSAQDGRLRVRVNGEERRVTPGTTVRALVDAQDAECAAVARNWEVLPRGEWARTVLVDGDEVEIVRPVQGGAR